MPNSQSGPRQSSGDNDILAPARKALQAGRARTARVLLDAMEPSARGLAEYHEVLAIAHARLGEPDRARSAFDEATSLAPKRVSAHYNYAVFLAAVGDPETAAVELGVVLMLQPDHARALRLAGVVSIQNRDRANRGADAQAMQTGRADPVRQPPTAWARLKCQSCGGMNFVTALTCVRCGSLLSQEKPIVPVE